MIAPNPETAFKAKCDQLLVFAEYQSQINITPESFNGRVRALVLELFPESTDRRRYYDSPAAKSVRRMGDDVAAAAIIREQATQQFNGCCDHVLIFAEHHANMPGANYRGLYHRVRNLVLSLFPDSAVRNAYYASDTHEAVKRIIGDLKEAEVAA